MQTDTMVSELEEFLNDWRGRGQELEQFYRSIYETLHSFDGIKLDFSGRPGISYSLRPGHPDLQERSFFAVCDVIDDDPDDRWLSICFYGDLITDPEERGELIPGGLAGGDGYCFDVYSYDDDLLEYLKKRLTEAYSAATSG